MKNPLRGPWAALLVVVTGSIAPAVAQEPKPPWTLVWSDEFAGPEIDRTKWDFDTGNGFYDYGANMWLPGWGNDELQFYTKEPENAFVKDGMLHIRAIKESHLGSGYTSARLKSRKRDGSPLFNQAYGRFEFRAKLPTGQGVWPALWMLPQNDTYGTWPLSGEIDILEARGQEPNKILGTLHFGAPWPANAVSERNTILPDGATIADFHDYALEWEPGEMRWYFDGKLFATQNFWWSGKLAEGPGKNPKNESEINPWPAPFDQPFYIVMNLAIGGKFLGNPDKTTKFPVEMLVDHVRVYEKTDGYGKTPPRGPGTIPFARP